MLYLWTVVQSLCPSDALALLAGMLPLARELLRLGTVIVLAANAAPSINDITAAELAVLVNDVARLDGVINKALESRALSVVSTGTGLPVLDLSKVLRLSDIVHFV